MKLTIADYIQLTSHGYKKKDIDAMLAAEGEETPTTDESNTSIPTVGASDSTATPEDESGLNLSPDNIATPPVRSDTEEVIALKEELAKAQENLKTLNTQLKAAQQANINQSTATQAGPSPEDLALEIARSFM